MRKLLAYLALFGMSCGSLAAAEETPVLQQTLCIIKPDAVSRNLIGPIVTSIEEAGLEVIGMKMLQLTEKRAGEFYIEHKDRPFYGSLVQYMASGPIVAIALEGDNAVSVYRNLMGPTDPKKAPKTSLRGRFGVSIDHNSVHGSDSVDNGKREIAFFFAKDELN